MDSINMDGAEEKLRSMNRLTTKLVTKYKDDTEGNGLRTDLCCELCN